MPRDVRAVHRSAAARLLLARARGNLAGLDAAIADIDAAELAAVLLAVLDLGHALASDRRALRELRGIASYFGQLGDDERTAGAKRAGEPHA